MFQPLPTISLSHLASLVFAMVAALGPVASSEARTYAAIVVAHPSGAVLHQDNADTTIYPASLTKMMTLYLTFRALDRGELSLGQRLPVSPWAQVQSPTKLGLQPGNTIAVEQAILALVTKSANDAAVVLAEAIGGSESAFAAEMTRTARSLGMTRTTFANASGLPNDRQVTTARDLAKLGAALVEDWPQFYPYFKRASFQYGGRNLNNHNHLMERYPGMDGIKTGYINASGFNLVGSAVRDGQRLVAVVVGGRTARQRDDRMALLLDQAFAGLGKGGPLVAEARTRGVRPVPPVVASRSGARPAVAAEALVARSPAGVSDADDPIDEGQATGGHVQLAALPIPKRVPDRKATTAARAPWSLHVGSFPTRAAGSRALKQTEAALARHFGRLTKVVQAVPVKRGTVYRVRISGLPTSKAADAACAAVRKAGQKCVTVAPG